MFCLRSWLPLLFIPTNASPAFILLFFISTYFLHRPCVYCSILLLILFVSSCYWSDQCFFDLHSGNWFEPRHLSSSLPNPMLDDAGMNATLRGDTSSMSGQKGVEGSGTGAFLATAVNQTASALAGAAVQEMKLRLVDGRRADWTGIGVEWIRSLLGRREWRLPCVDVLVRL